VVRQSEVADFPAGDLEARLLLDQRRRAGRRRLQDGQHPLGDERLVEATLEVLVASDVYGRAQGALSIHQCTRLVAIDDDRVSVLRHLGTPKPSMDFCEC
jgi:hypothetical protein